MTLFQLLISLGLTGLLTDISEFVLAVRFARPDLLWILLVLPLLELANRWAAVQQRLALTRIGRPSTIAGLILKPVERERQRSLTYLLAWVLLIIGLAGPRWGKSSETGIAVGRDVVVLVDLSRTMLADDMADPAIAQRWKAAQVGALDLLESVSRRGGHRVAVVVFAAHPKVLCHLTTDYDHVRAVLHELDGDFPPPEIRPGPTEMLSGTRIGAGIIAAVMAHDQRFLGSQDIILISDGDDPGDDNEWIRGADSARNANIPVHTVGVGNPDVPAVIALMSASGGELVSTQLQEEPLIRIAAETRGSYLPARRQTPRLGEFFASQIEPYPNRVFTDDSVPLPKERYPWFLALALMLFMLRWFWGK
jgi:Ca-activated chloride channel family protein